MSVREQLNQLTAALPDYKLAYVLAYVQGLIADEKAEEADTMKKRNSSVFGQSCAGMTDAEEDSIQDIFAAAGTIGGQFAASSRGCMTLFELRGEYI